MKSFLALLTLTSLPAWSHGLNCDFSGGPSGIQYPDNVDTLEVPLKGGLEAHATRRAKGSSLAYELFITRNNVKLESTKVLLPISLGNGQHEGTSLVLDTVVDGLSLKCELRI